LEYNPEKIWNMRKLEGWTLRFLAEIHMERFPLNHQ
jgi:hypothetical protein